MVGVLLRLYFFLISTIRCQKSEIERTTTHLHLMIGPLYRQIIFLPLRYYQSSSQPFPCQNNRVQNPPLSPSLVRKSLERTTTLHHLMVILFYRTAKKLQNVMVMSLSAFSVCGLKGFHSLKFDPTLIPSIRYVVGLWD